MPRSAQDVTEAELTVLQALWDRGPATIRQLTDVIYPRGGASHYATVQKLLERLEVKGHVRRAKEADRGAAANVFEATVTRDELIGRRLRTVAEQLCGGSLTPLLTHLVRARRLSARERQELRALIDELDRKNRSRSERS